ncbi:MAG TPA: S8 family serine peptidase [Burkholderiaceae bacterium]|nr:S8 family serine peptidase [Burkholderiaceae bacterium]
MIRGAMRLYPVFALVGQLAWAQAPPIDAGEIESRQMLVMLALAPAHFRPDADYGGAYDTGAGHQARRRTASELAQTYGLTVRQNWPMPALGVDCFVMEVAQDESVNEKIRQVARDGRVESVQPMHTYRALEHNDPMFAAQPAAVRWQLGKLHQVTTGRGVSIAQLDSGADLKHPDLAGQVIGTSNFVDSSAYTPEDHGTAVAGILVARADNGIGIVGVAPGARLWALRACWQWRDAGARCNSFTLAKALQFAIEQRFSVVNMSLTGPPDVLLARLLDALWQLGTTVVAAADPQTSDGGFPASHPRVLAVRAEEDAPTLDSADVAALAPGRDIPTTLPGARWGFVSGSSFAAAHVSGLVALLLELSPALDPEQVRGALSSQQRSVNGSQRSPIGRIDACAALGRVAGRRVCYDETSSRVVSLH